MSYTYLQEQGEVSSVGCFSDIPVFVLSSLNLTAAKYYYSANGTESCPSSPSGMMSEPSTENRGEEKLTLFVGDSHVRESVSDNQTHSDSKTQEADYGANKYEWFAKFDPDSCGWKTRQLSLFVDLEPFSVIWPRNGMMLDGECFPQPMLDHCTSEKEFGYWPTPTKSDYKGASDGCKKIATEEISMLRYFLHFHFSDKTQRTTYPNPIASERLMLWPIGWTDLQPLATDKFRQWLNSHGKR
jgi:hypothetical protein